MFEAKTEKYLPDRQKRFDRQRDVSNQLYLFQYSPHKSKSPHQKQMDLAQTKHQKSANYLLKKQQMKDKKKSLEGSAVGSDHRCNIERLKSLIKNSRTFTKSSDSGIQKMIRALDRLIKSSSNIKYAFESIKRQSMTGSSNNLELFLQSRHPQTIQAVKSNNSQPKKRQEELGNIKQTNQELTANNQSFGYFRQIPRHLLAGTQERMFKPQEKQASFSFRSLQTPKEQNPASKGNITTQQDLSFSCQISPVQRKINESDKEISLNFINIKSTLQIPKAKGLGCKMAEQSINHPVFHQQSASRPLRLCQLDTIDKQPAQMQSSSESDEIQLLFSQVAFIFTKKVKESVEKKPQKPSSPIYQMLYALPAEKGSKAEYHPQVIKQSMQVKRKDSIEANNASKTLKKQQKRETVTNAEIANRMLYGEGPKQQKNPQKSIRNPLMLQAPQRKRISSLPRITFTYTSRQKYERQVSPQQKKSIHPITTYKHSRIDRDRLMSNKDTSRTDIQTNFESRPATSRANPRFGPPIVHQNQHYGVVSPSGPFRCPKVVVSPRGNDQGHIVRGNPIIVSSNVVSHEYYGNYSNQKKEDQKKAFPPQRERITTAQPNMQYNVQYASNEQKIPWCCLSRGKETRSRSMNDRVLLVNQNLYQS